MTYEEQVLDGLQKSGELDSVLLADWLGVTARYARALATRLVKTGKVATRTVGRRHVYSLAEEPKAKNVAGPPYASGYRWAVEMKLRSSGNDGLSITHGWCSLIVPIPDKQEEQEHEIAA
jgi:hypothetical protein